MKNRAGSLRRHFIEGMRGHLLGGHMGEVCVISQISGLALGSPVLRDGVDKWLLVVGIAMAYSWTLLAMSLITE